tara:strand:+ start:59984 stop:60691 length:708 start_codon:yes stop_codon:yes gene_type:complete
MRKTYSDRLFIIDFKTGTLELNKDEIRKIREYRDILERDRGKMVEGDHDGRKKLFAKKELYYVYIMADPFNMYSILNEARKHQRALEDTGLISIKGWKPDEVIKDAMKAYLRDMYELSPTAKAVINSRKALDNVGNDIALLNEYSDQLRIDIEARKDTIKDIEELEEEKIVARASMTTLLTQLSANNKEVFNLTSTLPDRIDALENLKIKLSKEDSERDEVIGGGGTYRREDPRV